MTLRKYGDIELGEDLSAGSRCRVPLYQLAKLCGYVGMQGCTTALFNDPRYLSPAFERKYEGFHGAALVLNLKYDVREVMEELNCLRTSSILSTDEQTQSEALTGMVTLSMLSLFRVRHDVVPHVVERMNCTGIGAAQESPVIVYETC